jgi:flagellar hook-associated protein 1 FlgK
MQIARVELGTDRANDLRDKRDLIIDELSGLAMINVVEEESGSATVFIGAMALVDRDNVYKLAIHKTGAEKTALNQIVWAGTDKSAKVYGGEIEGLREMRDKAVPRYMDALDEMVASLVNNINRVHRAGYGLDGSTGLDFFDSNRLSAADIQLSEDIGGSPDRIAAASEPNAEGNNINALALADLRSALLMDEGTVTISGFYQSLIGKIGADSGMAQHSRENMELLLAQVDNARQSVQGVSLDEEMAQMVKFQHAYDAAARVITTMDEALETVITKMGITGR